MLRCSPSRITLTSSDISDFDRRATTRQCARFIDKQKSNLRLSPGPSRQVSLARNADAGIEKVCSSSSLVTACGIDDEGVQGIPTTISSSPAASGTARRSSHAQSPIYGLSAVSNGAAKILETSAVLRQSPTRLHTQAEDPPPPAGSVAPDSSRASTRTSAHVTTLVPEGRGTSASTSSSQLPEPRFIQHDSPTLASLNRDVHLASPITEPESRPFSSARARRRHARSNGQPSHPEAETQRLHTRFYRGDAFQPQAVPNVRPPPIAPSLDADHSQSSSHRTLNSTAPVFVPRTRFGTATESSHSEEANSLTREPRWNSLDSTHSSRNLRIRPSSEQNIDPAHRQRATDRSSESYGGDSHIRAAGERTNTSSNQTPNLDRYSLLRLPVRSAGRRPSGALHLPVLVPPAPGRRPSDSPSTGVASSFLLTEQSIRSANDPGDGADSDTLDGAIDEVGTSRSTSPTDSANSGMTPAPVNSPAYEPMVGERLDLHSWSRGIVPYGQCAVSQTDATREIKNALSSSRGRPAQGLDAATEFLRMRNSPLDDLTERLSRLSGRPRSVGHSWERRTADRGRVSLLAGDPFRQDSSRSPTPGPTRLSPEPPAHESIVSPPRNSHAVPSPNVRSDSASAVASHQGLTSSPALPSTPPVYSPNLSSPRHPLADKSPAKTRASPGAAFRRRPVPAATAPLVKVYDDAAPPHTQPQTPADIPSSTRRARGRSETTVNQVANQNVRSVVGQQPHAHDRRPHRNTYPATTPPPPPLDHGARAVVETSALGASPAAPPITTVVVRAARQATSQRGSQESENDMEGQLHGLEQDRQVWLSRHEGGSLDTTPPTEGRYERFLS